MRNMDSPVVLPKKPPRTLLLVFVALVLMLIYMPFFWWSECLQVKNIKLHQDNVLPHSDPEFRDEYFQPILRTFQNTASYMKQTKFRSGSVPKVFLLDKRSLTDPGLINMFVHFTRNECPLPCTMTDNITDLQFSDAVLVFFRYSSSEELNEMITARDPSQPWIIHSNECQHEASHRINYTSFDRFFNRTMFYRRDADVFWTHGFVVSKKEANVLPPSWHAQSPVIEQEPFEKRKMAIAFISHCGTFSKRENYIKELSKYIEVDVYGSCGSMKCGRKRLTKIGFTYTVTEDECILKAAKEYLFYLSFENSICEDYVTEKAYNIQYYPVVPVVFGGADYTKLFPPNSYINALHYTPQTLAKHLKHLAANRSRYEAKLTWRQHYDVSTISGQRIFCQLCTKLYDPSFYEHNVYQDFHDWFDTKSNCTRRFVSGRNITKIRKKPY